LTLPTVLAFGGNALLPDPNNPETQESRAEAFARALLMVMPKKAGMVLLHGNGPQVGMILLRIEATRDQIPPESLDVLVAETQGSIGYLLSKALRNAMVNQKVDLEVATIMTQVVVDEFDQGFKCPCKPVGPFYSSEKASLLREKYGWDMVSVPKKGWRRVVPSPRPKDVVEMHTIKDAVRHGHMVIAGGGGGIPVVRNERGHLNGVVAVIDKDLTAALLAVRLNAAQLVILTDVPHVSVNFGTSEEKPISFMDVSTAKKLLQEGQFPPGTMGPKVEAATDFSRSLGRVAFITDVDHLAETLKGKSGTTIVP